VREYDETYMFDLQGYLLLPGAVTQGHLDSLNQEIDAYRDIQPDEWRGCVHCQMHHPKRGLNLQNVVEGGLPFEELIDHPVWIDKVRNFVGESEGLFIDENFVSVRGPGESINLHSGGASRNIRSQFRYHDGKFHCGMINILLALTDIGPGDGATLIVPSSHKSNLPHPTLRGDYKDLMGTSADGAIGAVEVHIKAGDAILFVDALAHGSAERKNSGERRVVVYRYGPRWSNTRFGYQPSSELLQRLNPTRRSIIQPIAPLLP
tara:strand:+ start:88 stop:876 length:789 start_codon:yes stop_codon:yes gene_type:complete